MEIDLTQIVIAIVGIVTTWAIKELATWLRGRAKNECEKALVDQLEKTVSIAVGAMAQTAVKEAKAGNGGIAWDPEGKAEVKLRTKKLVKSTLAPSQFKSLVKLYDAERVEELLDAMIEHRVWKGSK